MKALIASVFALSLLAGTAAEAAVGVGVHIGGVHGGVNVQIGGHHRHHRHCVRWVYRHHERICRRWDY